MDVGVRELKQALSAYLKRAERGELIRVTEHGHPKVLIVAIPGSLQLQKGIVEGWITAPSIKNPLRSTRRFTSHAQVLEILTEDRGT